MASSGSLRGGWRQAGPRRIKRGAEQGGSERRYISGKTLTATEQKPERNRIRFDTETPDAELLFFKALTYFFD